MIDDDALAAVIAAASALLRAPVPASPVTTSRWHLAARATAADLSTVRSADSRIARWKAAARLV